MTVVSIYSEVSSLINLKVNLLEVAGELDDYTYKLKGNFINMTEEISDSDFFMVANEITFHAPSEHTINGLSFDLELQISLKNTPGWIKTQMVSVLFRLSNDDNSFIDSVIKAENDPKVIDLDNLFSYRNSLNHYYKYVGSITTPPCSEDVTWYVWTQIQEININQLSWFSDRWANNADFANGRGNNRNIQDSNERSVTLYEGYDDVSRSTLLYLSYLLLVLLSAS